MDKEKEKMKAQVTPQQSRLSPKPETNELWSVQCGKCFKWRLLPTQEEYEEIRKNFKEKPFICTKKQGTSCRDPPDIEYNNSYTWAIDKPNIPKTPLGFKRKMAMRKDFSRMDCIYTAPNGRRLRSISEVVVFIEKHPEYKVSVEDFSFTCPKVVDETRPNLKLMDDGTLLENEV